MLLSEELALVAIDPDSGRLALGTRAQLNACLAGLMVAELLLEGVATAGKDDNSVIVTGTAPDSAALAAAAQVVADKGPKVKAVLSHMNRGLDHELGTGTWDTAVAGLMAAGLLGPAEGTLRPKHEILDSAVRDAIIARLQTAAAGDGQLDVRTALLLSMTGPAHLLEVVAPRRSARRHARHRIDHALDQTELKAIGKVVRKLIAEAQAAAAAAATIAASSSG